MNAEKKEQLNEPEMEKQKMEELIAKTVEEEGGKLSEKQKKQQIDALQKVMINGMKPKDAMGFDDNVMEYFYDYAYNLYNSGNFETALKAFQFLHILDPESSRYLFGMAAAHHKLKNYLEATEAYYACTILDASSPMPFYHMSDCFLEMNAPYDAYFVLSSAIERCGSDPQYAQLKSRCEATMTCLKKEVGL